jgi:Zn finger protein HypA/HybF involved in hydrogenase expression
VSATLEHPTPAFAERRRPTLEQALERAWSEALRAEAECPVCSGVMTMRAGAAECADCGSRLS